MSAAKRPKRCDADGTWGPGLAVRYLPYLQGEAMHALWTSLASTLRTYR